MKKLLLLSLLVVASLACQVQSTTIPTSPPAATAGILATVTRSQFSPTLLPVGNTIPTNTPAPACTIRTGVEGGAVNIRACAGVDCAILTQATEGDLLTVLAPGAWVKVQAGEVTGWVNSKFCEVKP